MSDGPIDSVEPAPTSEGRDCWWVIHEAEILRSLRQAAAGASPDVVLLELVANTEPGDPS